MLSPRNLIVLAVLLVVLGGLYFATSGRRANFDEAGGFTAIVPAGFEADVVYGITARKQGEALELSRTGDGWVLSSRHDAPANENKVATLLGNLESAEGEFRSASAAALGDYALADTSALHLELRGEGGDILLHLLLGKRSGGGNFVRRDGSDEVYLASHNFLGDFGIWGDEISAPRPQTWMDLAVFSAPRDSVRAVTIEGPEVQLAMEKEFAAPDTSAAAAAPREYEWRVTRPDDFLAVKTRADGIVGSLASMRMSDVVSGGEVDPAWGLGEDAALVRVLLASGDEVVLEFGAPLEGDENARYFRVRGEPLVWKAPGYLYNNIFKPVDELRPENG